MLTAIRKSAALAGTIVAGLCMASPGLAANRVSLPPADGIVMLAQAHAPRASRKTREGCPDQRQQNRDQRAQRARQQARTPQRTETECQPQQPGWILKRAGPETRWPLDR
jgi:hypothetical protein